MHKEGVSDMNTRIFLLAVLATGSLAVASAQPPNPRSFFPHGVGDRWDYWNSGYGYSSEIITRDSIGADGSHTLFYDHYSFPTYRIDTSDYVFYVPQPPSPGPNSLFYKLGADSGEAWRCVPPEAGREWGWVARVESRIVFFRPTVVKVFQFGPVHPDSSPTGYPYVLVEDWLASGFGLVYRWMEPYYIASLRGCIIAGDTFGIITSIRTTEDFGVPHEYHLKQNYPNPFNPSTEITLLFPQAAFLTLRVFDLIGREVGVLAEGNFPAGKHRFIWNAGGFPSGVYFCRMQANGNVHTIKMLLAK